MKTNIILQGDALTQLKTLPSESIDCIMTSPPYWALRDYGVEGQLGLEKTFDEYIKKLCDIFDEIKRVLKKSGSCWINIGDTYSTKSGTGFVDDNLTHNKHLDGNEGLYGKVKNTNIQDVTKGTGINKANELRGSKNLNYPDKSLCMIPFRFAIEMVNRGWILRNNIIWHKPNCMPSSVKDRFTVDFEYFFFFVKSKRYYFETQQEKSVDKESYTGRKRRKVGTMAKSDLKNYQQAGKIQENGWLKGEGKTYPNRNKRSVWRITTKPFKESHFATFPEELIEIPIKAGCPSGGIVLDPFLGSGTTGLVALKQNKKFIGIELNPEYIKIAEKRLKPYLEQEKIKW